MSAETQMRSQIRGLSAEYEQQVEDLKKTYSNKINELKAEDELQLEDKENMMLTVLDDFASDYKQLRKAFENRAKKIIEETIPGPDHEQISQAIEKSNKNVLTRPIPDFLLKIVLQSRGSANEKLEEWKAFKHACSLLKPQSIEDAEEGLLENFIEWREKKEKKKPCSQAIPDFLVRKLGARDAARLWSGIIRKVKAFEEQIKELRGMCKLQIENVRAIEDSGERKQKLKKNMDFFDAECRKACAQFVESLKREIRKAIPGASQADIRNTVNRLNKNRLLARWLPDAGIAWLLEKTGGVNERYVELMTFAAATSFYKPKKLDELKQDLIRELVKEKILEQK